ncbi:MAG: HPr(Ser) kinase/phosphatase [Clostridia bacterium]|nr:HPr(Ser) kinase/phosphatase [Clostridia bacterium]
MIKNKKVDIQEFISFMKLEVVTMSNTINSIESYETHKIGLQMAGYFEYFPEERIQIIGMTEYSFFYLVSPEERIQRAERIMQAPIPCLIVCRDNPVPKELLDAAKKYDRTILKTKENTSIVLRKAIEFLNRKLAKTIVKHGVLVDINGVGTLIVGKSGIGKSETALELIKRGHRLVGDDAIEITKISEDTLMGQAPTLIKNFLEIRGIGIINIAKLFGMVAIKDSIEIDLIVNFEQWDDKVVYDRLGLDQKFEEILDVKVPYIKVPIKPGRNLAILLETAAVDIRQKKHGYNAAAELDERTKEYTQRKADESK